MLPQCGRWLLMKGWAASSLREPSLQTIISFPCLFVNSFLRFCFIASVKSHTMNFHRSDVSDCSEPQACYPSYVCSAIASCSIILCQMPVLSPNTTLFKWNSANYTGFLSWKGFHQQPSFEFQIVQLQSGLGGVCQKQKLSLEQDCNRHTAQRNILGKSGVCSHT